MKLLLEIESNNSDLTVKKINNLILNDKESENGIVSYSWVPIISETMNFYDDEEEGYLPRERQYFSSNRLSVNKITMDDTKYTNPQLTHFECCICFKVKSVSKLLVDYLGRCVDCR